MEPTFQPSKQRSIANANAIRPPRRILASALPLNLTQPNRINRPSLRNPNPPQMCVLRPQESVSGMTRSMMRTNRILCLLIGMPVIHSYIGELYSWICAYIAFERSEITQDCALGDGRLYHPREIGNCKNRGSDEYYITRLCIRRL